MKTKVNVQSRTNLVDPTLEAVASYYDLPQSPSLEEQAIPILTADTDAFWMHWQAVTPKAMVLVMLNFNPVGLANI